jgi:hypothetical protein
VFQAKIFSFAPLGILIFLLRYRNILPTWIWMAVSKESQNLEIRPELLRDQVRKIDIFFKGSSNKELKSTFPPDQYLLAPIFLSRSPLRFYCEERLQRQGLILKLPPRVKCANTCPLKPPRIVRNE